MYKMVLQPHLTIKAFKNSSRPNPQGVPVTPCGAQGVPSAPWNPPKSVPGWLVKPKEGGGGRKHGRRWFLFFIIRIIWWKSSKGIIRNISCVFYWTNDTHKFFQQKRKNLWRFHSNRIRLIQSCQQINKKSQRSLLILTEDLKKKTTFCTNFGPDPRLLQKSE